MPPAAIMKKSNIGRTLLVLMAISSSSTAAIYSVGSGPGSGAPDIYAFKPLDLIFPGFLQRDFSQRPDGYGGFAGFLDDVRHAVQSQGGAPRPERIQEKSLAKKKAESKTADNSYESSFPIKVGRNSTSSNTTEIYLGFSVNQVLKRISSGETNIGVLPPTRAPQIRRRSNRSSSASARGRSLSSGSNWLSGGFLNSGNWTGNSGFGFDLRPLSFPGDPGNGVTFVPPATDTENSKSLIALRRWVWGLFFSPFAYISVLVMSVFLFMLRFRNSPA